MTNSGAATTSHVGVATAGLPALNLDIVRDDYYDYTTYSFSTLVDTGTIPFYLQFTFVLFTDK
jgi:hypothetical protein